MLAKRSLWWRVMTGMLLAAALSGCQMVSAGSPTATGTVEVGAGFGR